MQFSSWYFIFFFFLLYCIVEKRDFVEELNLVDIRVKVGYGREKLRSQFSSIILDYVGAYVSVVVK